MPSGKTLSHILQHVESLIIEDCIALLKKSGVTITSYNYDGMQVLKQGFDETFVADMNAMVQERYYKTVSFIIKPFKAGLDLSQIEAHTVFNSDEFHLIDTHEYKKEYFEKFHFKVGKPACYVRLDEHNVMHIIKLTNLQSIYSHLRISVWIPEFKKWFNKCFIDEWNKVE